MKKIAVGDLGEFWYGDYKEPFEQLEGGVPGHPVGVVLKADDGALLCAFCGKTYHNLGIHTARTHGMPAPEYKREVGLLQKTALVSEKGRITSLRTALRNRGKGKFGKGSPFVAGVARPATVGRNNSMYKPEYLNKTGRCYAQALAVATMLKAQGKLTDTQLRKSGIWASTVETLFGSMDELYRLAGSKRQARQRFTDHELLMALRHAADALGRTPSRSDLNRLGLPGRKTLVTRFGSYAEACRKAGLDPNLPVPLDSDLEAQILTAYATHGSMEKTQKQVGVHQRRVEAVFAKYGAPFVDRSRGRGGPDTSARRAWAAEMARRVAA